MSSPREFNPPDVMLARLAYALHLGAGVAAVACGAGGLAASRVDLALWAVALLTLAATLRWMLWKTHRLDACEASADAWLAQSDAGPDALWGDEPGDTRLETLLEQRDAMEARRGTPDFDPWAYLELRRAIEELRKTDHKAA